MVDQWAELEVDRVGVSGTETAAVDPVAAAVVVRVAL